MTTKTKQNPALKRRALSGGREALYLEYYNGRTQEPRLDGDGKPMFYTSGKMAGKPMFIIHHDRKKEELRLYLYTKPRTPEEREHNKAAIQLAEGIRYEREQSYLNDIEGYRIDTHKNDNIIAFFERYYDAYNKKDIRVIRHAANRFKLFLLADKPGTATRKTPKEIEQIRAQWKKAHGGDKCKTEPSEADLYRFTLKPRQLTPEVIRRFVDYLKANSNGGGAASTYARFKKMVLEANRQGIINVNPCEGIVCKKSDELNKDILSADEITRLLATHYEGESNEIRRAFIFSLYTGIRFCDVKGLRFTDVDYTNKLLTFEQSKTAGHSAASRVYMPLRAELLQLIGTPEEQGRAKSDAIFQLPSHTMCLKALRHWTARAGIDKHITWHCARHSFATNILNNGANVKVVATLLGHSGLRYVEKYTRALDEAKEAAINSLPDIPLA